MSDHYEGWKPVLSEHRYRWVDRASKLLGVVLIGTGLHVGGGTATGLVVATLGVVFGLLTVVVDRQ
ncbi:hypothetical protein [Saliphagus infecundisoli]|uniref:DUF8120 domain-containing protein n=1 Tax=Saliphagus infecundisoli TaxID=1849069 RepID=A0ABD5QKY6_9EURY|nr:hypothetical protein [Saliphagus infecundisoli]